MAEQKQFKLREDLEGLLGSVEAADGLYKQSRVNPNLDNTQLREQAEKFYGDRVMTEYSPSSLVRKLKANLYGRSGAWASLDAQIDKDTFVQAKKAFTKGLDDEAKSGMYLSMLAEGIMPKEPEKDASEKEKAAFRDLQLAKRTADFAEALEMHAVKGDVNSALREIAGYAQATGKKQDEVFDHYDMDALTIQSKYGAPAARENEKAIFVKMAYVYRNQAAMMLKEKNLYDLVDSGIENTKYGKAIALKSMYEANGTQEELNKAKAEEAKKAKK